MPDVSIGVSVRNNASRELGNISRSTQVLESDIESLSRELDNLRNQRVTLRTNIDEIKKELQAARREFDGTEESVQRLQNANLYMDTITEQLNDVSRAARNAQRDLAAADDELSRSRAGGGIAGGVDVGGIGGSTGSNTDTGGSTSSLLSRLGEAGAWAYAGDILSNTSQAVISSAYGSNAGTMFGSVVSGATSGAAIGSMVAPGIGTAVGAGLGALGGVVTGATQIYEEKDDAFKEYVQTQTENQLTAQEESLTSGSSIAAQREKDLISFTTLFQGNKDLAQNYLNDVKNLSNSTPFLYDDLTSMSKILKTYGFQVENMIPTLTKIGDAGAALGMGTDDMGNIATSLGRMYMGGNATREDLDILNDRGINAVQYLADAYGTDYGSMLEKISDGEVLGRQAVEIILNGMADAFSGAMANQSLTFEGLSSTLEGWQQEMDAAMGQGFNDIRKQGLQAEIDYLSSDSGQMMQEANYAIGAWKAELENEKERLIRKSVEAMMNNEDYKTAEAAGDAAEMGKLIMEAKVRGMNEYNASTGAQLALESELALAGSIRENTASNSAYYNAGLRKGQEYTKGVAAGMKDAFIASAGTNTTTVTTTNTVKAQSNGAGSFASMTYGGAARAFGIDRVPYDDYPVRLHQGERVLTANQARQMDNGSSAANININISGMTVREDADIDRIAAALVQNLKIAKAVQK